MTIATHLSWYTGCARPASIGTLHPTNTTDIAVTAPPIHRWPACRNRIRSPFAASNANDSRCRRTAQTFAAAAPSVKTTVAARNNEGAAQNRTTFHPAITRLPGTDSTASMSPRRVLSRHTVTAYRTAACLRRAISRM